MCGGFRNQTNTDPLYPGRKMTNVTQQRFWLVWNPDGKQPPKHRHTSLASAIAEAERLVRIHRKDVFWVMESVEAREVFDMVRIMATDGETRQDEWPH